MVTDLIETSHDAPDIRMSEPVWDAMMALRSWLFDNVYLSGKAKAEEPKAFGVVVALFKHYLENPELLADEFCPESPADVPQAVTDYVSGMTDRFALRQFEQIVMPKNWMF